MKVLMVGATGGTHISCSRTWSSVGSRRPIKAVEDIPNPDMPGLPQGATQRMKKMIAYYDHYGLPGGNSLILEAIPRREPRTLSDFFSELQSQRAKGE